MIVRLNSNTLGGTTYLLRILKAAKQSANGHVQVIVNEGTQQESVFKTVHKQLNLLHAVTDVHFTHTLSKQD